MAKVLIAPDGSRGTVDDGEVEEALANGYQMADAEPSLMDRALPIAGGAAALGAGGLAASRVPAVTRQLSREPGALGSLARGVRAAVGRTPRAPEESAPASSTRTKLPASLVELTEADIAQHPQLKAFKPGQTIRRATYEKIKLEAGPKLKVVKGGKNVSRGTSVSMSTEPVTTETVKPPAVPGPGYTQSGNKQRGASGPELASRQARAERIRAARTAPAIEPPSDLETALRQSLEAEQAMGRAGLSTAERVPIRAGLRGRLGVVGPPALELLTLLMGAQHVPEDMEAARRVYFEGTHPNATGSTRRALLGEDEPQGF